jgi:hypothetical protein
MTSSSLPPPAEAPDDGYNATWSPDEFPDTVSGNIEARITLKFTSPRDPNRTTFEKLTILKSDGELIDVLGGSARLARLIAKHDPRPGDSISITHFGLDGKGWPQFGVNVDKSARLAGPDEETEDEKIARQAQTLLGDAEAA